MTEISVGFTIVTPGSLDPGMHSGLEVKWLKHKNICKSYFRQYIHDTGLNDADQQYNRLCQALIMTYL